MKKKNNTIRISYYGILGIVLLFGLIIGKLIYVSNSEVVDGMNIKTFASNRNTTTTRITASRGTIYSVNGEALAKDVNSYTVIAILDDSVTKDPDKPRHVVDKEYTANVLSEYIHMSPEAILNLLNMKGFQVELGPGGRNISEKQKIDIESLELPGISFISSTKRYYPYGDFASYIIGYAKKYDEKIVGELGVEGYYNNELTGKDGSTTYQQDAYGYQIADTPVITEEAENGLDIYLTIDSNIQMYLENAIAEMEKESNFEWVTVTVANAKTGAILGSASTPSYDPNKLNITNYNNPLVSYSYEPGSTMKIFSFMAAIEEGIYVGDQEYLSGSMKVGNDTVPDWNKYGWGMITYDTGFTYSSNVAAANLGLALGREKLVEYYKKLGFGRKTGIEMADEYTGTLKPTYEIEVANAAFGQGITTTPIQNIQALTSLANDGVIVRPYIVDKVLRPETGELVYKTERTELATVASHETVEKMLELMNLTVNGEDGAATGKVYATESTSLIGKTGTAQIASATGGYSGGTYNNIRSFAGLFPYEDPEYIIYISVKKLEATSSALAKPVKSIVESIAKYKNLDQLVVEQDTSKIISIKNYINKDIESSKEELMDLGLEVITIGDGSRVINQYPTKGSTVVKESKIFLLTNSPNITMPSMLNWTSNEVGSYCNLVGVDYNISGYGRVSSQSVEEGTSITPSTQMYFALSRESAKADGGEVDGEDSESGTSEEDGEEESE